MKRGAYIEPHETQCRGVKGSLQTRFGGDRWVLPGMTLKIRTPLAPPEVSLVDDPCYGRVVEVRWPVDGTIDRHEPVLEIEVVP